MHNTTTTPPRLRYILAALLISGGLLLLLATNSQARVRVTSQTTSAAGQEWVQGSYTTTYGHTLEFDILMPEKRQARMVYLWRLAPSFWTGGRACDPFTQNEAARFHFVFICMRVDTKLGKRSDHAYADPIAIQSALHTLPQIQRLIRTRPTRQVIIGSSASAINAAAAISLYPHRFHSAVLFDMPTNLALRYNRLTLAAKARTTPAYGGPPTDGREAAYLARSPEGHIRRLAESSTRLHFFVSREDKAVCVWHQAPRFFPLYAQATGRDTIVHTGTWHHGRGWNEYNLYALNLLTIQTPAPKRPEHVSISATTQDATTPVDCTTPPAYD